MFSSRSYVNRFCIFYLFIYLFIYLFYFALLILGNAGLHSNQIRRLTEYQVRQCCRHNTLRKIITSNVHAVAKKTCHLIMWNLLTIFIGIALSTCQPCQPNIMLHVATTIRYLR